MRAVATDCHPPRLPGVRTHLYVKRLSCKRIINLSVVY